MKKYIVYDGFLRPNDIPLFKSTNRAFRYGDAIFETMRYHKGRVLFWEDHYKRLLQSMAVMKFPLNCLPKSSDILTFISDLTVKNRNFLDSRVRLTLFRRGEGYHAPEHLEASWIIEADALDGKGYILPEKGVKIDVFEEFPKNFTPASAFKSANALPYIMAGIFCKQNELDDCLVVNGYGKIIESINSNLFWIQGEKLFTPLVSTGCIDGVMRKQICLVAGKAGLTLIENEGATLKTLLEADEIFLTNSVSGIKWVGGFRQRRYLSRLTSKVFTELKGMAENTN